MATQTSIPARCHGPQSHFHSEGPSKGPCAAHNLLREWTWGPQAWGAERATPPHAECTGWRRFHHNRPPPHAEHHCRLKERPVAQAVVSLANRLRSRMQNNQANACHDHNAQQAGPAWPRVIRRRRGMSNFDRETDVKNSTDVNVDEDWVILSEAETEASRGAAPQGEPQAPSLQVIRERCKNVSSEPTTMKSVGMGRTHKERNIVRNSGSTATTAFDSQASFAGWAFDSNQHHKIDFGEPEGKPCFVFAAASNFGCDSPRKNRNRGFSDDSFDSQGRRRPRNCFVKVRKHMRRHVKKWAAARNGPCPKHHHTDRPPPPKGGVSFPIKHEMRHALDPVDLDRVPSWLTPKKSAGKRPSHDWNDPSKDGWYKSQLQECRKDCKGRRKRKMGRRKKSEPNMGINHKGKQGMCQDQEKLPQKRKMKRFRRKKKAQKKESVRTDCPGKIDFCPASPQKSWQPDRKLDLSLITTPGAFHADGYYDCMKGKVLSRITSTAPLLPPAQLFWSLAKAGLTLSDRANRAAASQMESKPTGNQARSNVGNQQSSACMDATSTLCSRLIMGEVACSVLGQAMANSSQYQQLLLFLRHRLLMRMAASALPHPLHSLRDQTESMARDICGVGLSSGEGEQDQGGCPELVRSEQDVSRDKCDEIESGDESHELEKKLSVSCESSPGHSLVTAEEHRDDTCDESRTIWSPSVSVLGGSSPSIQETEAVQASSVERVTSAKGGKKDTGSKKTIKVVVLGDSCSGKTSLSKGLVPDLNENESGANKVSQGKTLKRKSSGTVGVEIRNWDLDDNDVSVVGRDGSKCCLGINLWDIKGDRAHHATQELVFSDKAVYILMWDMAHGIKDVNMPADVASRNCYRCRAGSGDSSSDEEIESADYYLELEAASQRAKIALEKRINESVIFWYDRIAKKAPNSIVVPVASFSDKLDQRETYRRCAAMKQMLLNHSEYLKQESNHVPKLAFEDCTDMCGVFNVNTLDDESVTFTREKILEVARHVYTTQNDSTFQEDDSDNEMSKKVEEVVDKFRTQKHKVVPLTALANELNSSVANVSDKIQESTLLDVLSGLEREGSILMLEGENGDKKKLVVLQVNWLLLAVSSITRSRVVRKDIASASLLRGAHSNCPLITTDEIRRIWKGNDIICRAALRASKHKLFGSVDGEEEFYNILQRSLVRSRILDPVDVESSDLFFLPSLLAPQSAESRRTLECWSYKCVESWKTILCNSWKVTEGSISSSFLMQKVISGVLREVHCKADGAVSRNEMTLRQLGTLRVHEVLCWNSSCYLKLGSITSLGDMEDDFASESIVELFIHLVDEESPMCVASELTGVGNRRLLVSAKGQEGDLGRRIWQGGFHMVNRAVQQVMDEFTTVSATQQQLVCPVCLACRDIGKAQVFDREHVDNILRRRCDEKVTCFAGHVIDARLLSGHSGCLGRCLVSSSDGSSGDCCFHRQSSCASSSDDDMSSLSNSITSVAGSGISLKETLGGVVLVGLWDGETDKIVRAGSGFIVDRKRGLVVTAAHTLMDVTNDSPSFGENYFGMRDAKVVVGVIPQDTAASGDSLKTTAIFRYFGEIVAKDPNRMDACVVKITTRMENDVAGNGDGCALQAEIPLFSKSMIKRENLTQLPVAQKQCELAERVKLLGFNQGGEGRFEPGTYLNRVACYAEGYVCKWFKFDNAGLTLSKAERRSAKRRLNPEQEIVLHCPTIGGHSGGPCVNQAGEVIGILSRADNADGSRCYLVPSSDFMSLVEKAKRPFDPLDEFF